VIVQLPVVSFRRRRSFRLSSIIGLRFIIKYTSFKRLGPLLRRLFFA
jgi:hypothetical protein